MTDKQRDALMYGVCWLFSAVFLWTFFAHQGFPPQCPSSGGEWTFLFLALLFVLLPFVSKLKIGKLIEIERELGKTKEEVKEHHQATNQMFQTLSASVSAVANLNNTINITLPGNRDLIQSKQTVEQAMGAQQIPSPTGVRDQLKSGEEDNAMALVKARIRMERLLREILGKKSRFTDSEQKTKFMGLYRLFGVFVNEYPQYRQLMSAFADINNVMNAAAHAQLIPESQAETTLDIAADLIAVLENIRKDLPNNGTEAT